MHHQHSLHQTPTDIIQLQRWMNAHTTPQAIAMRARIVATAHTYPTWNSRAIARFLGVSDRLVRKWRQRWEETHCLNDLPRSGAPRRFPPAVRAQVTAIACSLPRSYGVPLAHWSRAELARHVATTPSLPVISPRTIGRWLAAEQIRPWRFHSWQQIQDCSKRAPGSFVLMRKPRSKHVKPNTPLAQRSQSMFSTSLPVIIDMEQYI